MDLRLKILYKNKKVEEQFNPLFKKGWRYSKQVRQKIEDAHYFIEEADSLFDIASRRSFRFEKLKGNRKDEWSIRLGNTGYRVTLIPCGANEKPLINGDILKSCKVIKIVMVTEVSNHYE